MVSREESERQHNDIQRDIGRLEGKVDSLLTAMQNMTNSMVRADADRDNLVRDVAIVEQRLTKEVAALRARCDEGLNQMKSKLYWLGGVTAAGGAGLGAGATKVLTAMFIPH